MRTSVVCVVAVKNGRKSFSKRRFRALGGVGVGLGGGYWRVLLVVASVNDARDECLGNGNARVINRSYPDPHERRRA